jgi:hypothetical protein
MSIQSIRQHRERIVTVVLVVQLLLFRDYIFPIQWGQIKVSGLACTCPDETVQNGRWYLQAITPDSFKKYDLDYSEIYVSPKPASEGDWMGGETYMIQGQVIGVENDGSTWHPKVKVRKWWKVNEWVDRIVKILFGIELLILRRILKKMRNPAFSVPATT